MGRVLRPLIAIAADKFRECVDIAVQGVLDTISDDYKVPVKQFEEKAIKDKQDNRSIHSVVKPRSYRKRRFAGRQAGVNGGRNVTFRD
jgi:hypothetical protein